MNDEPDSRTATDELLAGLRAGRWRPAAWSRFLLAASRRSVRQALAHPRALTEVTLLHAVFGLFSARKSRMWILTSWLLSATHLGMLERQRSIGLAGAITLTRANMPVTANARWLPVAVLGSDVLDGWLARKLGTESRFGAAADSLADAAFWVAFGLRHEPGTGVRVAVLLAWAFPVVAVTVASVSKGRMVDAPRPIVLRPAAVSQAILVARAILRGDPQQPLRSGVVRRRPEA